MFTRCHREDMAGIGSQCGKLRRTYRSCLAEGRIDVYILYILLYILLYIFDIMFTRCHREDMAGIGSQCGKLRRTYRSCLAEGRIDVYKRSASSSCSYKPGLTTGVVCCKKPKKTAGSYILPINVHVICHIFS